MTTTTADKGELLPCPCCGKDVRSVREHPTMFAKYVVCSFADGGCGTASGYFSKSEQAIAAWNRRNTNEGQDGLTDDEILAAAYAADFGIRMLDGRIEAGYREDADITDHITRLAREIERRAVARHLSSKQADHLRDATKMVKADATKMVKADAVKMPEPDGWLVKWPSDNSIKQQSYVPFKPKIGYTTAVPRYTADQLQAYATAHTAEAVRELVESFDKVLDIAFGFNVSGVYLAEDAGHRKVLERAADILAKYAPSQEGKNGG